MPEFLSDHPSSGNRVEAVQAEARTLPPRTYNSDNVEFGRVQLAIAKLPSPPDFRATRIGVGAANLAGYKKLSTPQFSVEYPETWLVRGDAESNLLAIAPRDGVTIGQNGEPALGMGAVITYFFPDPARSCLSMATSDLIQQLRRVDSGLDDSGTPKNVEVDHQSAIVTAFTSDSPLGGGERDLLVTTGRKPSPCLTTCCNRFVLFRPQPSRRAGWKRREPMPMATLIALPPRHRPSISGTQ